ncbi:hypothetical protein N7478_012213 [Penicillium angulare]|uniref:uncharacterized protein n=1 Tax=Penicillium angulare TaxID=116970 RepID=UPI00254005C4|nr:uncharacterized protein N7478_012213 [Penicillium angulare]KAJ5259232.1 hypothetical protein N7478_012213 [Penicillium angulare]
MAMSQPANQSEQAELDSAKLEISSSAPIKREIEGDLFDAPSGSVLMHACSAQGVWGKGIALEFKRTYPAAFQIYKTYCMEQLSNPGTHDIPNKVGNRPPRLYARYPVGTTLIIPPQDEDQNRGRPAHWIACMFTSYDYGRRIDSPQTIRIHTAAALDDLKIQLEMMLSEDQSQSQGAECPKELYSCRFNSGLFHIPWAMTRFTLERARLPLPLTVVYPPNN